MPSLPEILHAAFAIVNWKKGRRVSCFRVILTLREMFDKIESRHNALAR
jgi:hypothetical protein